MHLLQFSFYGQQNWVTADWKITDPWDMGTTGNKYWEHVHYTEANITGLFIIWFKSNETSVAVSKYSCLSQGYISVRQLSVWHFDE